MSQWFFHHHGFASYLEPVMQQYLPAWRSDSYRGKVIDVEHSDSNYSLVTLKLQRGWPVHTAGQHIQLTIENNGRLLTRTFTVASSPDLYQQQQKITLLIRRQKQGQFTGQLTEIIKWINGLMFQRRKVILFYKRVNYPLLWWLRGRELQRLFRC
ncbi:FAD-binding oxidoreductase [Psychrobium sp. nBUS_13]|uniref:FAD-binding oxidoreductase n=1 Tax=Psychrobium sp. nBUS_13 TaxID=3395319 RepID=UPI003EBDB10B